MATQLDEIVDFRHIFLKIIKNWFFFSISMFIAFSVAFAYNRYTYEFYLLETSILVKEDTSMASDLLSMTGSSNKKRSIENKSLLIKAFPLVYKTLEDLRFDISYYIEGNIKTSETYTTPIYVICPNTEEIIGREISVKVIDVNSFFFLDMQLQEETIRQFGEKFFFNGVEISIIKNSLFHSDIDSELPRTIVKFYDLRYLTQVYQRNIVITQKDRESTVINISILSRDQQKGSVFLNKLIENYINNEVEEKNLTSIKTVQFINNQLLEMSDSLALIEQQIQEYKNKNQVTDLSLKAQSIYNNLIELEANFSKSKILDKYYHDFLKHLINRENFEVVLSTLSSFVGADENLNTLIKKLVEVQIKKNILIEGGQVNNPAIAQYNRQITQLTINLLESIKTARSDNNLMLLEFKRRIDESEKALATLPKIERELLSIERLQSISESMYIFLLKKRAEAKITSSSNIADSKVLEPASSFNQFPVSPNKKKSYMIALLTGLLFPLLFIFLEELLNDKIIVRTDLEKLSKVPILGIIGRNYSGYNLLSQKSPKSSVYEGFRALRSNLNFLNPSQDKKVYLVTSSISGEGKTYIAENLSIVFAKSGKKTLVIGADLRRPKLYSDFGLENKQGISNHILSDLALSEIILKSEIENLDIMISGPIPSNPSDALLTDKFANMMGELRKVYDIIILDTPPLGLVADSLSLMNYSDINLYVTRQNYTKKGLLSYVNDMYEKQRLGELHLVFNDVKEGGGAYGYGYGYGYGYEYGYSNENDYFDDKKLK